MNRKGSRIGRAEARAHESCGRTERPYEDNASRDSHPRARSRHDQLALRTGFWRDEDEIDAQWIADHTFLPSMSEDDRAMKIDAWRRAVKSAKGASPR